MSRLTLLTAVALSLALQSRAQNAPASEADLDEDSAPDFGSLSLEQLMQVKVEGAALHPQTLRDAPASVTVITAEDIRKYGYRTLGEALASVRGFYITDNRSYETIGVRGFNAPGDYSSHVLVMVNGHNMTDNIFNFELFVGNDFPIDLNLIKQIEIIRGPSSALYGSNGIFATINIITKAPEDAGPASFVATVDSFGEKKGQVVETASLGRDAKVLLSASVFNNAGESPLYFPEFNNPQNNYGEAIHMNTEKGYHLFANLVWRNWTLTAAFAGDDKIQPISWGATIFNDRGSQNSETRNFVDATYTRPFASGLLTWRTFYDEQYYVGRFAYSIPSSIGGLPVAGIEDNHGVDDGKWIGSDLTYRMDLHRLGTVTGGLQAKFDLVALQTDDDLWPVPVQYLNVDRRDRNMGIFLQDERKLSNQWTLVVGVRLDKSRYDRDFLAPRAALIYQPASAWTFKFLYGRSFRNPSAFQLFDADGLSAVANPAARPESVDTAEIDIERRIGRRMNLLMAGYGYWLRDYLQGVQVEAGFLQYQNVGSVRARGIEIEINGRPFGSIETTVSYALQEAIDSNDHDQLENSPEHLAKFRLAAPVGRKLEFSTGMQFMSSLGTLADARVPSVYLADFTVTSHRLLRNFDFKFGIRNAFNRKYSEPIALNPAVDTMPQPGRSVFVELIPHAAQ